MNKETVKGVLFFLLFFCMGLWAYSLFNFAVNPSRSIVSEELPTGGIISEIAAQVSPSVVGITNLSRDGGLFNRNYTESAGSGVILDNDGYIVTNNHVVRNADRIIVTLVDGNEEDAQIIGIDPRTDLALIKIKVDNHVTPAKFGNSDKLAVGEGVIAIGNPLGLRFARSVTSGVVSGLNRLLTTEEGFAFRLVQTDAAINPGNSGGALVNLEGNVVGINTVKIAAEGFEGMGFSIPSNQVMQVVNELKMHGTVKRPLLGIRILGEISDEEAEYQNFNQCCGVMVEALNGAAAHKAGIRNRDIITRVNGKTVTTALELEEIISGKEIGETVKLVIARPPVDRKGEAQVRTVEVKLEE